MHIHSRQITVCQNISGEITNSLFRLVVVFPYINSDNVMVVISESVSYCTLFYFKGFLYGDLKALVTHADRNSMVRAFSIRLVNLHSVLVVKSD